MQKFIRQFNENALIIEDGLDVRIISGDKGIRITGSTKMSKRRMRFLRS